MIWTDRFTGARISEREHIRQSVYDILTTRIGSRVMQPDYGSGLPDLIDEPTNERTIMLARSAVATAIRRHEPRIKLETVDIVPKDNGVQVLLNGNIRVDVAA